MTLASRRSLRTGVLVLLSGLICLAVMSSSAHAAAGALDPSFSGDGLTTVSFGPSADEAQAIAVQRDGKSVSVGCSQAGVADCRSFSNSTSDHFTAQVALTRHNRDGSLDTSFGVGGRVLTTPPGAHPYAVLRAVAIQPDGKIVVAGGVRTTSTATPGTRVDFFLARYTSRGVLDTTFGGGDGMVITPFGDFYDQANGLALLSGGRILLAGLSDRAATTSSPADDDFALARYNPDGTLDTSFDGDGKVTTAFGPKNDGAGGVLVTRSGKYIAAGEAIVGGNTDSYAVARYDTNGQLDSTFSGDGKQTVPFGASGNDYGSGVKEQSDGKIVVSGEANSGGATGSDFGLARLLGNGNLDPTFAGDGTMTTDFAGGFDSISELAIQRDGKIVAAGNSVIPGTVFDFTVERVNPNGSLDKTFSADGKASANFGPNSVDVAYGLAVQADGRILVNGYTSAGGTGSDFALARFRGDEADLRAGLSDRPDPATRGRTVLYTASARNNGPEAARNATLNMALPSRARLLSTRPSQGHCFRTSGKNLRCEFGTIGSGKTARVSVRVRPIHRPRIRTRIVVASDTLDTAPANNRAASSTRVVAPHR